MGISINEEKAFEKIRHPFKIKEIVIEGIYLKIIMVIYDYQ
jgi:hypothetical protein